MTPLSQRARVVGLFGWLAAAFVAAAIGSVASIHASSFYAQLARPEWAPPGWVFGPVWTALYTLMGIAAWLVWCVGGFRGARAALTVFLVQLAVNALWSWLFFGWQLGALSFADIVVLLALIVVNIMLLAYPPPGRAAARPLPCVGQLCLAAELHHLAIESRAIGLKHRPNSSAVALAQRPRPAARLKSGPSHRVRHLFH